MRPLSPGLLEALSGFPNDFASSDPQLCATYGSDWTRHGEPCAGLVVRPRTTDDVSRFMALCHRLKQPVVPSGGRTGLAGGALALQGEVVLSLERLDFLGPVDTLGQTVRVGAGATTERVHFHCREVGLTWPIDLASKGSSEIGGNIATNAGGVRVIRHGLTRHWVLGLTVVLADGTRLELNGALEKNNTGIDLRQLFIGSEGILGIITEATLKLCRPAASSEVALVALSSLERVLTLFESARRGPFVLGAYEFFTGACLDRLLRHRPLKPPFHEPASHYVLFEAEQCTQDTLLPWLSSEVERGTALDATVALNATQARALWEYREGISESLSATGLPHKNDIALPIAGLQRFCDELVHLLAAEYPGWELCLFGHIGDGNLHVNVMKPDAMDPTQFKRATEQVDEKLFGLVERHGGSISAEHGIGLLKRPWLKHSRTPDELALMRSLKNTFDPLGILNPGKVL